MNHDDWEPGKWAKNCQSCGELLGRSNRSEKQSDYCNDCWDNHGDYIQKAQERAAK